MTDEAFVAEIIKNDGVKVKVELPKQNEIALSFEINDDVAQQIADRVSTMEQRSVSTTEQKPTAIR